MTKTFQVSCIQFSAGNDWQKNLTTAQTLAQEAVRRGARLIALPENFCFRGEPAQYALLSRLTPRIVREFSDFARKNRAAVLLGSLIEPAHGRRKFYNTSFLISEKGRLAAVYRKIHLFDIGLADVKVCESKYFAHGKDIATGKIGNIRAGLTICYDLRFPELFRQLASAGCKIAFVPANFTAKTGRAHWEVLLRARAIENQMFVIAPAQTGVHPESGIRSYGNSLIVDPWGNVLARGSESRSEIVSAGLDFTFQNKLRKSFPVLQHR